MSELIITFTAPDADVFKFSCQAGDAQFAGSLPRHFSSSIHEDLRLLRWKAAGLRDPGDTLLIQVGVRLSSLLFPSDHRADWTNLLAIRPEVVRILFQRGTGDLLHLPWELLHVDGHF